MPRVDGCVVDVREIDERHRDGRRSVVHTRYSSRISHLATGNRALLRKASRLCIEIWNASASYDHTMQCAAFISKLLVASTSLGPV